jgi:hypothetical protein
MTFRRFAFAIALGAFSAVLPQAVPAQETQTASERPDHIDAFNQAVKDWREHQAQVQEIDRQMDKELDPDKLRTLETARGIFASWRDDAQRTIERLDPLGLLRALEAVPTQSTPPVTTTENPTPTAPPAQTAVVTPPPAPPPTPPAAPTTPPEQAVVTPQPQQQTPAEPQIASVNPPERGPEPPRPPENPPPGVTDAEAEAFLTALQQVLTENPPASTPPGANPPSDVDLFLQAVEASIEADRRNNPDSEPAPGASTPRTPTVEQLQDIKRRRQQATVNPGTAAALNTPYSSQPRSTYNPPQHRRFSDPPPTWKRRHTVTPSNRHWRNNHRFTVRRYTQPQVNLQRSYRTQSTHRTTIRRCRKVGSRVYC